MRSSKLISREDWPCLITYADTMQGHTGHIYRSANWEYLGLTKPEKCYKIDGVIVSRKAGPKTRTHKQMLALGAVCVGSFVKHRFRLIRRFKKQKAIKEETLFPC